MRLFSALAVLSAVLAAGSINACCFFCWGAGPPPVGPVAPGGPAASGTVRTVPEAGYTTYLAIESVGGKAPNTATVPWQIDDPLPAGPTDVVVNVDFSTGQTYPVILVVTDLGPRTEAPPAGRTGPQKVYRRQPFWGSKFIQIPSPARAARDTAATTAAQVIGVYVFYYSITTDPNRKYSVYAEAENSPGPLRSQAVHFRTAAPPIPTPTPPLKK